MNSEQYKKLVDELIELLDEGVYIVDKNGTGIHYNKAMAKTEKVEVGDVLGKKFHEAFPDFNLGESTIYSALVKKHAIRGNQQTYKNIYGKEITTENSTIPVIVDGEVVAAIEVSKDITELRTITDTLQELREKNRHAGYSYFRQQDLPEEVRSYVPPLNYEELIGDRTAQSLRAVFAEVLKRKKSRVDPIRSGFGKIQKEEISVADKELYIRAYLQRHPHADFREMLELEDSKEEIIVTFLVILELMKNQKIRITQEEAFGKILIDLVEPEKPEEPEDEEPAQEEPASVAESDEEELVEPASLEEEAEPVFMAEPDTAPETGDLSAANAEPEVPEPEQKDVQEPPRKRHLIARPRMGAASLSRHTMPIKAKRMGKDRYLIARGSRIWSRRRNRDRRIRGYKKN